ncbi:hypothetical protein J0X14_08945 [Muricauda sp. CAU 1633]|uniref:hypothetical protein n=1 Tax=Allomuricauda sp. CAU 1633 TaxID=2816036 RepID=UPI001A8C433E|nr:hypothetical protein [Muricauda sp. CAU 1633]MBO0322422.1 hypothetical protein [Muricauda sp. CAU 1633]
MKIKIVLLLTASLALSLSSCMDGKKKTPESTTSQVEFHKIVVDDYEIGIPKDMQQTTGLNNDASLQRQNIHKEIYTIVIDEPKKEFITVLNELDYGDEFNIALYRDIQLKRLAERMQITYQSESTPMTISGLEAEAIEIDAKVDNIGEELSYFLTFIDGKSKIHMVMSWTLKSKKKEHKKTFETIAQSFTVKD